MKRKEVAAHKQDQNLAKWERLEQRAQLRRDAQAQRIGSKKPMLNEELLNSIKAAWEAIPTKLTQTFAILALSSSLFLSLAPVSQAQSCGRGCGGGGNTLTINGQEVPVAVYLERSRLQGADLEALRARVTPNLQAIQERLPEFGRQLAEGFTDFRWYGVDVPLDQLNFASTSIPFPSNQTARQFGPHVFVNRPNFANLEQGTDRVLLMQELLERVMFSGKNVNSNISHLNLMQAANLLARTPLPERAALRRELRRLGFLTENLARISSNAEEAPMVSNEQDVEFDLARNITLEEAREAVQSCFVSAPNPDRRSLGYQLLHRMIPNVQEITSSGGFSQELQVPTIMPSRIWAYSGTGNPNGSAFDGVSEFHFYSSDESTYFQIVERNSRINDGAPRFRNNRFVNIETVLPLPQVIALGPEGESIFDQDGNANLRRRLDTLALRVDRSAWENGGLYELRNRDTQVGIANTTLNFRDFHACVQDQINRIQAQPAEVGPGLLSQPQENKPAAGAAEPVSGGGAANGIDAQ